MPPGRRRSTGFEPGSCARPWILPTPPRPLYGAQPPHEPPALSLGGSQTVKLLTTAPTGAIGCRAAPVHPSPTPSGRQTARVHGILLRLVVLLVAIAVRRARGANHRRHVRQSGAARLGGQLRQRRLQGINFRDIAVAMVSPWGATRRIASISAPTQRPDRSPFHRPNFVQPSGLHDEQRDAHALRRGESYADAVRHDRLDASSSTPGGRSDRRRSRHLHLRRSLASMTSRKRHRAAGYDAPSVSITAPRTGRISRASSA